MHCERDGAFSSISVKCLLSECHLTRAAVQPTIDSCIIIVKELYPSEL